MTDLERRRKREDRIAAAVAIAFAWIGGMAFGAALMGWRL